MFLEMEVQDRLCESSDILMLSELRDESAKMATVSLGPDQTKLYRWNKIRYLDFDYELEDMSVSNVSQDVPLGYCAFNLNTIVVLKPMHALWTVPRFSL